MKNIIRTILFFFAFGLFSFAAKAQSLKLIDAIESPKGGVYDNVKTYAHIKNISSSFVSIKVKVEMVDITSGHSFSVCIGETCYPPSNLDFIAPGVATIAPEEVTDDYDFYITCNAWVKENPEARVEGTSKIKITVFNSSDPEDKVEYNCNVLFDNTLGVDNAPLTSMKIFPNPTSETVKIDLSNGNDKGIYEIAIFDLLGSQVINKNLDFSTGSAMLNVGMLASGNYMLRISENGMQKEVKPLIIKR